MFGKRYGDVYRHSLPNVIAQLGKANLAKYPYTQARRKGMEEFFLRMMLF